MKICCTSGECYDTFTEIQCMGCYSTDHCTGPVEVASINPEDMPIIEFIDTCAWCGSTTQAECKNQKNCHKDKQSEGWSCMDHLDQLTVCGTFNTKDCTSSEELCKLLKPNKGEQE